MNPKNINRILERFFKNNPNPNTELYYTNQYTFLIAVLLSAQSMDSRVNKITRDLFSIIDSPQKMIELGEERLIKYIKTLGLYLTKARNIISLSSKLLSVYNNQIPNQLEELVKLPGIGRKTANVFLNEIILKPSIAVDTHVIRVSGRIGLTNSKNPLIIEKELKNKIPLNYQGKISNWLVLHGRYICKARKPLCFKCFINDLCEFNNKNLLENMFISRIG